MPSAHPDDEYLFEFDLDEKGRMQFDTDGRSPKFSDRAKAAQEAVRSDLARVSCTQLILLSEMEKTKCDLCPA